MNLDSSIALDALSAVYMLGLVFSLRNKRKRELLNRQYFFLAVLICAFLALDMAYLCLYGYGGAARPPCGLIKLVKSLYFLVNTAIVLLWANYIDCFLFGERFRAQRHRVYYGAVLLVNTALVFINIPTGILFSISSSGAFVVNPPGMWAFTVLNYMSVLLTMAVLIQNRGRVNRRSFLPLLIFPLPPLFAEMVQVFFREVSLLCTYAISALLLFQVSQTNTIYTDGLTGLSNRRLLDESLQRWFSEPKGAMVCGLMIDLDGLKRINDTYGHVCGDKALVALGKAIGLVRRKGLVSARYGGDEFLLVWLSEDARAMAEVEGALLAAKAQVNRSMPEQERIDFSVGRFCCRDNEGLTAEDFLWEIDASMYRRKNAKKNMPGPPGRERG